MKKIFKYVLITLVAFIGLGASGLIRFKKAEPLYLMEKASMFVIDEQAFEAKVREVSKNLGIPPEWLMAVMYSESRFDAGCENLKGNGLVGLIQLGPSWAKDHHTTTRKIQALDHIKQLDLVFLYFKEIREKYGDYKSLTNLYLAILQKEAINKDCDYEILKCCYKQNAGLDEGGGGKDGKQKDGKITVGDIDKRMQRVFPSAYLKTK